MTPQTRSFILCVIIAILCVLLFWNGCGKEPEPKTVERIVLLKSKAEKQKDTVIYRERVRTKYVVMWKEVRRDSLIPCETKLLVADTVILIDSSLIAAQKILINELDEIVKGQDTIVKSLTKQVKQGRRKGYIKGFFYGVVAGGVIGGVGKYCQ